jgi:hypothetical protein
MLENALMALIRSTLLDGFTAYSGYSDILVKQKYQPSTIGVTSAPTIQLHHIHSKRYGVLGREEINTATPDFTHVETQWWETTIQVGCTARRDPNDPNFLTLPSALDIVKVASDILQGDRGLALLAVQRVRPLRITQVRDLRFINDSDQYEAQPSFDIVLSHVQITESTTPPVAVTVPNVGRV